MSKNNENFTIVYYEVRKRLDIGLIEYFILDYIVFLHQRKGRKFRFTDVAKKFHISKNTVRKYILNLIKNGYIKPIQEKGQIFQLNEAVNDQMQEKHGSYIRIFHDQRIELKVNELQFGFLYLVYSLSRKNGIATMGKDKIKKFLFIKSDENYYKIVRTLINSLSLNHI